jgi:hypothetical protein
MKILGGFDETKHVRENDWHIEEHDMSVLLDLAGELLNAPPDLSIPVGAAPGDYYPCPEDPKLEHVTQMEIPAHSRPVFSSCSGLLSALWLVASRANSTVLRRRAIALMVDYPRREGVWDSVLAGRVAWESLMLEETALNGELGVCTPGSEFYQMGLGARSEYIPDSNKVRCIEIRYVAARMMEVEFQSVKQYEAGEKGLKRFIAW